MSEPRIAEPQTHQVTQLLSALGAGDQHAAEELLPLIYDELRKRASARITRWTPQRWCTRRTCA
jgi:hypothetical protein